MKTIYQRIRDAALKGIGIGLNPAEVNELANVEEIERLAAAHDRAQAEKQPDLPKQRE